MFARLDRDIVLFWFSDVPSTTRAAEVILSDGEHPLRPPIVMFSASGATDPDRGIALIARPTDTGSVSLAFPDGPHWSTDPAKETALDALLDLLAPPVSSRLFRHLLQTVPNQFRDSGDELARTRIGLLNRMTVRPAPVSHAIRLPSGKILIGIELSEQAPPSGGFLLNNSNLQRIPKPILSFGNIHHWILDPVQPTLGDTSAQFVGIEGSRMWRVPLADLRPRAPDLMFPYLRSIEHGHRHRLIDALQRWRAGTPGVTETDGAFLEDCRILFSRSSGNGAAGSNGPAVTPIQCGIDRLVSVPGGGAFVQGWLFDPDQRIEAIELTDSAGKTYILPRRWPTPHGEAGKIWENAGHPVPEFPGFVGFVPDGVEGPWRAALALKGTARIDLGEHSTDHEPRRVRDEILRAYTASALIDGAITEALGPTVERLHHAHMARFPARNRVTARVDIGEPPAAPSTSLIIPVYRNLNFLGFQLAALARGADVETTEIIYVLDSPEQAGFLEGRLRGEHLVYGLPVSIVVHPTNLGFAAACNTGASVARGDALVFLNSDVVPETLDWLPRMREGLARPEIGAVGPRLLYLDSSLQFAGMYYAQDPEGIWYNRHYFKGYPGGFQPANEARAVPAVTGACLMVERAIFKQLAGFDEKFVIGDFEDSDLCIRLWRLGLGCWYEPSASLYHLERQSVTKHDAHGNSAATMVNRWRQQRLWSKDIAKIMAKDGTGWSDLVDTQSDLKVARPIGAHF